MFIIDGHNLLHAICKIEENARALSEPALCGVLGTYLRLTGETAAIVFDGTGPPDKGGFEGMSNLEVLFAGLGTDADTIIEDKIKASTAPKGLTIVSSDRRLQQAAHARRAMAIKSEVFWTELQKQLSRKRRPREPSAKRQGLSQSETEQWLKVFGIEQ
ncbi:MAG TPA: NYN domain-containing protein [Sedimentisphaerales bacterium]|nr:NYN domain-containing protein [Sedimentisphaerales bacterium]